MRLVGLIVGFAIAAAALAACGGGDEEAELGETVTATPTPSAPTMTPEERAEAEALLKAAALRAEDAPEGLLLKDEGFTTNEEWEQAGGLWLEVFGFAGGDTLENPYNAGRTLGYHANYEADAPADPSLLSGTAWFYVSVDLFRDSSAAHERGEWVRQQLLNADVAPKDLRENLESFYEGLGLEVSDLNLSSLPFAEVGDEREASEVKATVRVPDLDTDFHLVVQSLVVRRDRLVGSVFVLTINESPDEEQLEALARTLDERMKDALEQSPTP